MRVDSVDKRSESQGGSPRQRHLFWATTRGLTRRPPFWFTPGNVPGRMELRNGCKLSLEIVPRDRHANHPAAEGAPGSGAYVMGRVGRAPSDRGHYWVEHCDAVSRRLRGLLYRPLDQFADSGNASWQTGGGAVRPVDRGQSLPHLWPARTASRVPASASRTGDVRQLGARSANQPHRVGEAHRANARGRRRAVGGQTISQPLRHGSLMKTSASGRPRTFMLAASQHSFFLPTRSDSTPSSASSVSLAP